MKSTVGMAVVTLALFAFSQASSAGVIIDGGPSDLVDVGSVDTFKAEAAKAGNPTAETTWVNSILGSGTVTFHVKTENVAYYATFTPDVFAFFMPSPTSEYFLIKNATRMALFQNLANLNWGVFDIGDLSAAMKLGGDEYQISHVTRFNGDITRVPEPGSLALLGAGLLALGLVRRRKTA